MHSSRRGISELPFLLKEYGVHHAVISPGSRNAPLVISLTQNDLIHCNSITDERSAGYFALGMAQQLGEPVALICTSGTAVLNYAPALAEAFYAHIPLIAITADRPKEWIDQNDGQTIRQENVFDPLVKKSFQLPVETAKEEDLWLFRRTIAEAMRSAIDDLPGPVHINVPLREPLYDPLPDHKNRHTVIRITKPSLTLTPEDTTTFSKRWSTSKKRLIICGMYQEDIPWQTLQKIAGDQEAVVIAENISGISDAHFIDNPDRLLASLSATEKKTFQPDLLITMGGAVLSKKLKQFLRSHQPAQHWHISRSNKIIDTFQALTNLVNLPPVSFFSQLQRDQKNSTDYAAEIWGIYRESFEKHLLFLHKIPFCDLYVFDQVLRVLPEDIILHLANSTPVRYSQLFPTRNNIQYFSNRGVSGIDGCVSTATGAASVTDKLNVLLTGDLAFIYDSNGLWNNSLPPNLRIIVVDNNGGNIFKIIDTGNASEKVHQFLETPHHTDIEKRCMAYNTDYMQASNESELSDVLKGFFKPNPRPVVLHITTDGDLSANIFKQYFQQLSK